MRVAKKPIKKTRRLRREMKDPNELYRGNLKPDASRQAKFLKPDEVGKQELGRKRGLRTDADCIDEICELVSAGMTCKEAREYVGVSSTQWGAWVVNDHEGAQAKYEQAKQSRVEEWADDMIQEADSATHTDFQGQKLRIEVKKWLMGKQSQKYADRNIVQGGDADKPVRVIGQDMTPQQAAEAYAETVRGVATKPAAPAKDE